MDLVAAALPAAPREDAFGVAVFASGGERGVVVRVRWMAPEAAATPPGDERTLLRIHEDAWRSDDWDDGRSGLVSPLPEPVTEVWLPTVIWHGPGTPVPGSRGWRTVAASGVDLDRLRSLTAKGRAARVIVPSRLWRQWMAEAPLA